MTGCVNRQLQPIPHANLRVNDRKLVFDGLLAHAQTMRKFPVRPAGREGADDLPFPWCQKHFRHVAAKPRVIPLPEETPSRSLPDIGF